MPITFGDVEPAKGLDPVALVLEAANGGCFAGSYAVVEGGVSAVVPVDLHIPGCPPNPTQLLRGLLTILEVSAGRRAAE